MCRFYINLKYKKEHLGDSIIMSYTDNSILKQIGTKIKLYRKISYPDTPRMNFYEGITVSDDRVRKIESGICMPDFDFLVKLSYHNQLPVDYFTESGFHVPDSAVDIISQIRKLTGKHSLQFQYEFIQELNMLKYSIFTSINSSDLHPISINETDKKIRGNILKNARIKGNMSVKELSSIIDRSPSTIHRMEAGSGDSSTYIWTKISREFSIPMDLFLLNRIKNYKPNLEYVIDYLICDTFLGLTPDERSLMFSIAKHYLHKKKKM